MQPSINDLRQIHSQASELLASIEKITELDKEISADDLLEFMEVKKIKNAEEAYRQMKDLPEDDGKVDKTNVREKLSKYVRREDE